MFLSFTLALWCTGYFFATHVAYAASATLFITPATAVFPIGEPFTIDVRVNTGGAEIGSADATVSFNLSDLSFVSMSDEGSVFDTVLIDSSREPGRIDISGLVTRGGTPFSGIEGLVARLTFMPLRNIATEVRLVGGSARSQLSLTASVGDLANILTGLSAATYTLVPRETVPAQQIANVATALQGGKFAVQFEPAIPESGWLATSSVKLSWNIPSGATAMRTGMSSSSTDTPTKVYPVPVSSVVLKDIEGGTQFFHLQFENSGVWGEPIHVPLKVDMTPPERVDVEDIDTTLSEDKRLAFRVEAEDAWSSVVRYEVRMDGGDATAWERPEDGLYRPSDLIAGEHVLTVVAYDGAGNSTSKDHVFTIQSIESPVLTNVPERVLTGDNITVQGSTYPDAEVKVFVSYNDGEAGERTVRSDSSGNFTTTIAEGARTGKYTMWFSVTDQYGAVSPISIKRSVNVSQPFIMLFGKVAVTYLSIIVPLVALILLLGLVLWLGYAYVRGYRKHVRVETNEAYAVVRDEFKDLRKELIKQIGMLEKANQSRELTHEEMRIFTELSKRLDYIESHIQEEIDDIEHVDAGETVVEEGVTHDTLGRYADALQHPREGLVIPVREKKHTSQQIITVPGHTVRIERV